MQLDAQHVEILQDIIVFSSVERYRGMLPSKLALCHDQRKIDELVAADLVERMEMSYPCGQESTMLKLTETGQIVMDNLAREGAHIVQPRPRQERHEVAIPSECQGLSDQQWQILQDIFHYSKISRFGGIMPNDETENYPPRELNQLFALGFIIRVKAEIGTGEKRKGYILSDKGLRCLGVG